MRAITIRPPPPSEEVKVRESFLYTGTTLYNLQLSSYMSYIHTYIPAEIHTVYICKLVMSHSVYSIYSTYTY